MKVRLNQKVFDNELADKGQRRAYKTEWVETSKGLCPVYREIILPESAVSQDLTPWWKKKSTRKRKK